MMIARRETTVCLALVLSFFVSAVAAQTVTEETVNGVRYRVTTRTTQRQVPVTVMQDRQQTVYTQQVTNSNVSHQQLYSVPVTQYHMQSRLNGRWNPFITPYWTQELKPVTTWHQQLVNVQIPTSNVAWVPQTTTQQVPIVQYRTQEDKIVSRVPIGNATSLASAQPASVRMAAVPSNTGIGGRQMTSDPPRKSTGWQTPSTGARY